MYIYIYIYLFIYLYLFIYVCGGLTKQRSISSNQRWMTSSRRTKGRRGDSMITCAANMERESRFAFVPLKTEHYCEGHYVRNSAMIFRNNLVSAGCILFLQCEGF